MILKHVYSFWMHVFQAVYLVCSTCEFVAPVLLKRSFYVTSASLQWKLRDFSFNA